MCGWSCSNQSNHVWQKHYVVAADRADLYAYFYERGVKLLERWRTARIHLLFDFLPHRIRRKPANLPDRGVQRSRASSTSAICKLFEGVTTYPAIMTLRKGGDGKAGESAVSLVLDELTEGPGPRLQ